MFAGKIHGHTFLTCLVLPLICLAREGCNTEGATCDKEPASMKEHEFEASETGEMHVSLLQRRQLESGHADSDSLVTEESGFDSQTTDDAVAESSISVEGGCGPPRRGGRCSRDISWAKRVGIHHHKDWYPGLTASSTDDEFQKFFADQGKCPKPCADGEKPTKTVGHEQFETNVTMDTFVGMGYTPDPHRHAGHVACDDFMGEWSEPLWGESGRNDLKVMKDMGATVVRTYGIGSQINHKAFLDHAHKLGLKVMPGFADYPYMRTGSDCGQKKMHHLVTNCLRDWKHDCHDVIKQQYKMMLENGYTYVNETTGKRVYHPALLTITLINECELKMYGYGSGNLGHDAWHAKIAVSAADGLLSAEDEMDIEGPRPLLTATVSLATCPQCKSVYMNFPGCHRDTPSLCMIADYYHGFMDPKGFLGYNAKHDLKEMYRARWVNSYNTPRPAKEICETGNHWVDDYAKGPLGKVPLYIAEFHHSFLSPDKFGEDIKLAKKIIMGEDGGSCGVKQAPLKGFNIFEYAVAYWKGSHSEGGTGMRYGMWGLGWEKLGRTKAAYGNPAQDVYCVYPARIGGGKARKGQNTNAQNVIEALGGKWPESPVLCK